MSNEQRADVWAWCLGVPAEAVEQGPMPDQLDAETMRWLGNRLRIKAREYGESVRGIIHRDGDVVGEQSQIAACRGAAAARALELMGIQLERDAAELGGSVQPSCNPRSPGCLRPKSSQTSTLR